MKAIIENEKIEGVSFSDSLSRYLDVLSEQRIVLEGSGWRGRGLGLGPPPLVVLLRVQCLAYCRALSSAMIVVRLLYIWVCAEESVMRKEGMSGTRKDRQGYSKINGLWV
jgi:hypothetical protein